MQEVADTLNELRVEFQKRDAIVRRAALGLLFVRTHASIVCVCVCM